MGAAAADHVQQALIANWAVAVWGSGPVTSVILPWRRRARPGSLGVSREGEGTIIRGEGVTVLIDANGYAYADGAGAVTRWGAPSRYDASSSRTLFAPAAGRLKRATDMVPLDRVALD